jgi:predicted  nucleic acid-binding Zn-ribbon protein
MKKILLLALATTGSTLGSIAEFTMHNELEARAESEAQEYQRLMPEMVECHEKEKNLHTNIELLKSRTMAHTDFILARATRLQAALNQKCRSQHFLMPRTEVELFAQTFAKEFLKTLHN